MSGVWDTAELLIAIAGDGGAAAAAARDLAADCRKGRRRGEAAFWLEVATAVIVVANPQPLIAPRLPPVSGAAVHRLTPPARAGARASPSATIHRLEFAERLPRGRKRMLRIKRKLRAILERIERPAAPHPAPPEKPKRGR